MTEVPAGTPLQQNRFITQGYTHLARTLQELVDPEFHPTHGSQATPGWFAFAIHASHEAGKGMLGAAIARRIIDLAQGEALPGPARTYDRMGLTGSARQGAEKLSEALGGHGLPQDAATALGALAGAMNLEPLGDPRTLWATAHRFARLFFQAPGILPLDKAESLAITLERMLNEGNVAIFTDIGGAALRYLDWRPDTVGVTPEHVLSDFTLAGAKPDEAQHAFTVLQGLTHQTPAPSDFARRFPGMSAMSLVVAGFALLERARQCPGPAARDALVKVANNCFAWREQADAVQPAFTPPERLPGEIPRADLTLAMTPLLRLELGTVAWNFADYAATQRDRDANPLTSKPTEYNWALLADRWPAILTAFELGYRHPSALWTLPAPFTSGDDEVRRRLG
ncbi:hypothetical protein LXT21_27920 [Myxococcus sp. K38C18041901]|uniref:hypothetical protein n=1 Tax=Myxococcus guangdongensis TaxID=2906760 RepID=UPI0020A7C66C|nr:hypothetical protein [Myxococcus guangdongensis]MCP3062618.1 hypothetical protein [Myxococcus guangdongensis]